MTQDDTQEQQPETTVETPETTVETPETTVETVAPDSPSDAPADVPVVDPETGEEVAPVPEGPIEVGSVTFVVVQRITPYGAFVALSDGRSGLIHISEIDRNYVKDVREHLREGDKVEAKVTAIKEDGKIDLSIKALQDPQPRMSRGSNPEFEQMLRKFMRGSEERQVDVKRSHMRKRK